MYCKFSTIVPKTFPESVLIVAKCIVNYSLGLVVRIITFVLIVAKCIVNFLITSSNAPAIFVLIVAKCIVN